MNTYEKVRFNDGPRRRTVLLRNVEATTFFIIGVEVDDEGQPISGRGFDERKRIIGLDLIIKRTPMTVSMKYGTLQPIR